MAPGLLTSAPEMQTHLSNTSGADTPASSGPPRVLHIDDRPEVTRLVERALQRRGGCLLRSINDAKVAVTEARQFLPDIVILDIVMPDCDGGDVAAQLRECPPLANVPVIYFSSVFSIEEAKAQNARGGRDAYVSKATGLEMLLASLEKMIDNVPLARRS
jgi:two-component system OmpR family response regulator